MTSAVQSFETSSKAKVTPIGSVVLNEKEVTLEKALENEFLHTYYYSLNPQQQKDFLRNTQEYAPIEDHRSIEQRAKDADDHFAALGW